MLSFKLIRFVEEHCEDIANRVVQQIRRDTRMLELGRLPEADLRERTREILTHLGTWLVSREDDLARRYETLGRRRFQESVPLHEIVYALQIIKEKMIEFLHDEGFGQTVLELYAEEEMERASQRIFDAMIFYVVKGYEHAMRRALSGEETIQTAH